MMGITCDTRFDTIRLVPKITPLIPITSPAINHKEIQETLKKITEPGFTPSTKFWVRKLEEEIAKKKAANNRDIAKQQEELQAETSEDKKANIRKKIAKCITPDMAEDKKMLIYKRLQSIANKYRIVFHAAGKTFSPEK